MKEPKDPGDERPQVDATPDPEKFNWRYGDFRYVPPTTGGEGDASGDQDVVELFDPEEYAENLRHLLDEAPAEPNLPTVGGACADCLADPCVCVKWEE